MSLKADRQLAAAAKELQKALKLDPYLYPAYYHLGLAYLGLGQAEEAKLVWRQGIEAARRGPDRPDYERTRAVAEMSAALAGLEATERLTRARKPPSPPRRKPAAQRGSRTGSSSSRRITGRYAVLFSSNLKEVHARADVLRLKRRGYRAEIRRHRDRRGRRWYRVWVGCCTSRARALRLAAELRRRRLGRGLMVMPMPKP